MNARTDAGVRRIRIRSGPVLVVVVREGLLLVRLLALGLLVGVLVLLAELPGLEHDQLVRGVPADRQHADPERLVDRLVQGGGVAQQVRLLLGALDAAALQLVEQVAQSLREGGDLDLLEGHGHDPRPVAGLEEEGPVARGAHRPGDEPVGGLEEVAASRHRHRGYRNPAYATLIAIEW